MTYAALFLPTLPSATNAMSINAQGKKARSSPSSIRPSLVEELDEKERALSDASVRQALASAETGTGQRRELSCDVGRPVCSMPCCLHSAEWEVPATTTRRNPDVDLWFCFACLERFVGDVLAQDGMFAKESLKRAVRPVRLGAPKLDRLQTDDLLCALIVRFERDGKTVKQAVRLARDAVRELNLSE